MIDFNKLERFLVDYKDEKSIKKIPHTTIIFRNEIIKEEDIKRVVSLFDKYKFDIKNISKVIERKQESAYRLQGAAKPFIFEIKCSSCGERFLVEDIYKKYPKGERNKFLLHFFDKTHKYSFKETMDQKVIGIPYRMFKEGESTGNIYLCKKCYEKIKPEHLEKVKIEQENRKAIRERKRKEALEVRKQETRKKYEETNKEAFKYIVKYENKNFDLYDAMSLFFNKNSVDMLKRIQKDYDLLDMLRVAFSEPQREEKEKYIREFYSHHKYNEFLMTPYWQIIASGVKMKQKVCAFCNTPNGLNVHHKGYEGIHGREHLKEVMDNELICLCKNCHERVHKVIKVQ